MTILTGSLVEWSQVQLRAITRATDKGIRVRFPGQAKFLENFSVSTESGNVPMWESHASARMGRLDRSVTTASPKNRRETTLALCEPGYRRPDSPLPNLPNPRFSNYPQIPNPQNSGTALVTPLVFKVSMCVGDCLPSVNTNSINLSINSESIDACAGSRHEFVRKSTSIRFRSQFVARAQISRLGKEFERNLTPQTSCRLKHFFSPFKPPLDFHK
uniref:SFRICE_012710 n=1 Tax=Spodoptera frugiperda TaxID=7108 RepID=A0A2H1WQR1_SPOFR